MTNVNEIDNLKAEDIMALNSGIAAFESKLFVRAYELLLPLAEANHPEAQYRLAIMSQNGLGMVKNAKMAVRWMKAAAEQGFGLAQHGLGYMYLEGDGVEQDETQAVSWFQLAAEQDLAGAQAMLGSLYEQGRGVPQDLEEAKRWYAKAGF
jgi:TPR repeat protein